MFNVNDMYNEAVLSGYKLLSNFQALFWQEYINNSARYDRLFRRKYLSFRYFLQFDNEDINLVTNNFIEDVYNHLMANEKKYSELYRINVVNDEDYSLLDNYNITEKMDKDITSDNINSYGARNDNTNNTLGSQSNTIIDKKSPYDTEDFYNDNSSSSNIGSRTDTSYYSKGEQIDDLNNTYKEDYTLTRKGNIGVQTGADMLEKHKNVWNKWSFYEYIFSEIAKELLLV